MSKKANRNDRKTNENFEKKSDQKNDKKLNQQIDKKTSQQIDKKTSQKINKKKIKNIETDLADRKLEIVEQDIYLNKPKSRSFPSWLLPMILVIALSVALIWFVPIIFNKYQMKQEAKNTSEQTETDPFLQKADAVLNQRSVAIWAEPNRQSLRITSGIYNEPVEILDSQINNGYYLIELQDGVQGYVLANELTLNLNSHNTEKAKNKVLLINREKAIVSDTSGGNVIGIAPMGCVLYADYVTERVVRVILPGGDIGWMSRENLVLLDVNQAIPEPEKKQADIFCSSALMFINVAYVPGGIDMSGIDLPSIIYLAGKTNGLKIPRIMQDQANYGTQISFERDKRGMPNIDALKAGDILFFSLDKNPDKLTSSAIYLADGNILYASGNQGSVQIISLSANEKIADSLVIVRRLFD
ncbi:MAG: C40 family peptidase [Clostridiaceae bacterium]|nr:C40 family peptidase [Clostridiaceae bacterium]